MKWAQKDKAWRIPVKCWSDSLEEGAMRQAENLAKLPCAFHHVSLMPDCHSGYGMPIGGVLALKGCVCPNAVGVDIGCGMAAVKTNLCAKQLEDMAVRRRFMELVKKRIPVGDGHCHEKGQEWDGFVDSLYEFDGCENSAKFSLDRRNLGTLGGGNHFIELQKDDTEEESVWMMIHSGSRNLGKRIADYYNRAAVDICGKFFIDLPDKDLAYLPVGTEIGQKYIADMNYALRYARESRKRMMNAMIECLYQTGEENGFDFDVVFRHDIHHNYASPECHFGEKVFVHRKGATSAKKDEIGIVPGSMGAHSYIVKGLGNEESFCSCSHGAGRKMSRTAANYNLTVEECDRAMEGIVCERWKKAKMFGKKHEGVDLYDLSEAPGAYKDIESVIDNERDLVTPIVMLTPLASLKG